ncbi:hypothetical protein Btru_067429 [Bulinus truncatus]|nr:hypothetical protein Btru_067429 [Bulinus truncatus]
MLVIPFYLMNIGDPYIPERIGDFSWAMVACGILFLYHFIPLQLLAYVSHVNLNNMLCPAVSDPFHGRFYRLFAMVHQLILIPSLGKLLVILARAVHMLPCDNLPDECPMSYSLNYETKCCKYSECSSNTSTEICQETEDSSEVDSGIIGNSSGGCNLKLRHHSCVPGTVSLFSTIKNCGHCCDHQYNCSCSYNESKDVGSIMHIVNGKIIGDFARNEREKESLLKKRETIDFDLGQISNQKKRDCDQGKLQSDDSKRGSYQTQLKETLGEINKSLQVSDLSENRNGHTKSH